jgi:hypothetical protein
MSESLDPNLDFWEPTLNAMGVIVECLPLETQKRICERLRQLAIVQEDKSQPMASYFSRAVSGEPAPLQGKVAGPISFAERVEAMLDPSYDFRDHLRHLPMPRSSAEGRSPPHGLLSAALKPKPRDDGDA